VKSSDGQNDALKTDEKYFAINMKVYALSEEGTNLCSHKSTHVDTIKNSKDDRHDNHYARNGED
jgi:hypothetical protein